MSDDRQSRSDSQSDHYQLSAESWDAKFGAGEHYATDKPFEGLLSVVDELRRRRIERILDVGCGDGRNLSVLTELAPQVVGLDMAEKGLRTARRRQVATGAAIHLARGDIGRLPFRDASFDAAINIWVMNHGTHGDVERYIAEMARVLRPGGVLFASVSAWSWIYRISFPFIGRKIVDASPDGRTYLLRTRAEEGIHHLFTRREIDFYFRDWEIVRLRRQRHRAEVPMRLPFWNVLAQRM